MKRIFCVLTLIALLLCGCRKKAADGDGSSDAIPSPGGILSSDDMISSEAQSITEGTVNDGAPPTESEIEINPLAAAESDYSSYDNTKKCWGQGNNKDELNRPTGSIDYNSKYGKYDAIYVGPDNGKIYLTFDEGYENGYTSKILDTLKQKGVSAMFFVTYDYAKENPDLIRRMIDEGHIVGNHTTNHPSMPTVSSEKAASEIVTLHNYIADNFGYTMKYFRPPMGEFSERTLKITQDLGYKSVFWSFAYADWDPKKQPEPSAATTKISDAAHTGGIFLLHAVSKTNTEILGTVIDNIRSKGFETAKFDL